MHDHGPPARESAVDLRKLPEPQRIEGIGHSHITVTKKSAEAQQWFDQGLALPRCFWDYEALRAFEESVRLDPNCAMCHWALARALRFQAGTDEQVKQELATAKELAPKTSDHEQRYIRAYVDSQDKEGDEGGREFDTAMETLIDRYPDDIEARLQLALHANGGYDHKGDPRSGALYAQALLKNILRDQPDNAAANHYWIHAMEESRHPEWALQSAETRLAIRFANWDDAIEHPMQFGVPDEKVSVWARAYRDGLIAYARGMKGAESDQLSKGEGDSTQLDALLWRLSQEQVKDRDKAGRDRVLKILGTASLELRGNFASHKGEYDEARRLLEGADRKEIEIGYAEPPQYSRPASEVLGNACIRAGKFEKARDAFIKELSERPHSGFALFGIAVSSDKQGKSEEAVKAYREFLDAWGHADGDLPPIKAAEWYLVSGSDEDVRGRPGGPPH